MIKPLTLLINKIIYTGEFSKQLKIVKVKPLFKKGNQSFDTLQFDILLNKLDYYGIQGCANRLICSYLSDRWQFVDFSGHKSSYLPIKTSVPQGSVLGPLMFLIYINDLPLVSNVFDMFMYADDNTLFKLQH